ncbi:MAG TPA: hypothetical protein VM408_00300 [Methylomirabilota bacterium]|nr:hypothetical protein [Methylomirabilota bacterium]
MTDTPPAPDRGSPSLDAPPPDGGERRLARPPSARYGSTRDATETAPASPSDAVDRASRARGIVFGSLVAIVGAVVIVALVGAFAISAGLLVAAAVVGYSVGLGTVAGAAGTLSSPARPAVAAALAAVGIVVGQVGLWLFARTEGGVLPLLDYLGETFGALVPLEILLAAAAAWWRAR